MAKWWKKPIGFAAAFMMAGAILLSAPAPAWAAQDEVGPGIELEKQLQEQQEAEQQTESQQTAEQQPEGQQPESQQSQEQASNQPEGQASGEGGADVPEIKAVYQAFMAGSGWSEEYGDNFECLKAGDYMTAVKASLRGQPEGMSGTLTYQVNVSGLGWQPWTENMAEAGGTQAGVVLESVKMDLTGDLKEHYDVYYMVYQNGVWTDWAANGNPAGQEGVGLRADGIRVSITKKGQNPPAEPEKLPTQILPAGVDPNRPMVALTFDDGPKASVTNRILNSLEAVGGRGTFFMVGSNVTSGNAPVIQRMVSLNCEVANHTNDHKYLSKIGADAIVSQVQATSQKIQNACGVAPKLVRPPGGYYDSASLKVLGNLGMPAIMWSIDTRDWQHKNPSRTISSVLDHVKDGDIILMHDIYGTTADAAEVIIPELARRGYQLVTVSELGAYRGGIAPGKAYSRFYR